MTGFGFIELAVGLEIHVYQFVSVFRQRTITLHPGTCSQEGHEGDISLFVFFFLQTPWYTTFKKRFWKRLSLLKKSFTIRSEIKNIHIPPSRNL